jgi:CubicO group peptidase (beta-lactamase class C family)
MQADGSTVPPAYPEWGETGADGCRPPRSLWVLPQGQPTRPILHSAGSVRVLPDGPVSDITRAELIRSDGTRATSGEVLAAGHTDAVVVLQDGRVVYEWYSPDGAPDRLHITRSLTKSVVGAVTGILIGRGALTEDAGLTTLVRELRGTGYDGATVRDVLDMRSGVSFREDRDDPSSGLNQLDRCVGETGEGLYTFLMTLRADQPHGGPFRYRSAETDALGWACERATGTPMPQLISELLWSPMGAERDAVILCDAGGTAIHDGGLCATARDLARFGQLLCDSGAVPDEVNGMQAVVPSAWIRDAYAVDLAGRQAFAASNAQASFPGGWYRNQMWFRPGPQGDVLLCLGVFGQMIHVNRATRTVCVKLSSWPTAQQPRLLIDTVRAFDAIGGQRKADIHTGGPIPSP